MENLNRIHLGGLRAIEAVGRHGSLKKAAGELGVTVGAVSQQVLKTEQQLGRSLFERHARGLRATAHGQAVLRHLTSGMAELSAAVSLAMQNQQDSLTVSVAPVFAGKWLVWRLNKFSEVCPDVRIRVDASDGLVDLNTSDVDLGIRVGRGNWPGVKAEKLMNQRIFPVCSPAMAGEITIPTDLGKYPVIRDKNAMFDWNVWLGPNGLDESILQEGPVFSDASLCLDAAIAGQGIFMAWETLAGDAVQMGRLIAPFADRRETEFSYWLVMGQYAHKSHNIARFQSWLKAELDQSVGIGPLA